MVAWAVKPEFLSPSVLITDDNDSWRLALEEILRGLGLHTFQSACGEEAIELVHTVHLDLVLIDFQMPRLNGIETLRIIRGQGEQVPAVMMTASPGDLPVAEVRALQVEGVLAKPTDRRCIVTTVTRIVRRRDADY